MFQPKPTTTKNPSGLCTSRLSREQAASKFTSQARACAYLTLPEVDGEVDELAVLLNEFPEAAWFKKLLSFFLQEETDGGASFQSGPTRIGNDGELASVGLPDVLVISVVFRRYNNSVSNCVCV